MNRLYTTLLDMQHIAAYGEHWLNGSTIGSDASNTLDLAASVSHFLNLVNKVAALDYTLGPAIYPRTMSAD